METNQKHQFRQQTASRLHQLNAQKQNDVPQEEPGIPIPDEPPVPEQPDENPNPIYLEPDLKKPEKDDMIRIDEETPIFSNY